MGCMGVRGVHHLECHPCYLRAMYFALLVQATRYAVCISYCLNLQGGSLEIVSIIVLCIKTQKCTQNVPLEKGVIIGMYQIVIQELYVKCFLEGVNVKSNDELSHIKLF